MAIMAPRCWISLPDELRIAGSTEIFKCVYDTDLSSHTSNWKRLKNIIIIVYFFFLIFALSIICEALQSSPGAIQTKSVW